MRTDRARHLNAFSAIPSPIFLSLAFDPFLFIVFHFRLTSLLLAISICVGNSIEIRSNK